MCIFLYARDFLWLKYAKNAFAVGALPRTPLGKLTTLPDPLVGHPSRRLRRLNCRAFSGRQLATPHCFFWQIEHLSKPRSYSHTVAYNFCTLKHCTVQCLNVRKSYLLRLSDVECQGIHVRLSDVETQRYILLACFLYSIALIFNGNAVVYFSDITYSINEMLVSFCVKYFRLYCTLLKLWL